MTDKQDNLESFAKRIESRMKNGENGSDSMERLICRLMTGENEKIAAFLAGKWVEWRYGKPKETIRIEERKPIESSTNFFNAADAPRVGRAN